MSDERGGTPTPGLDDDALDELLRVGLEDDERRPEPRAGAVLDADRYRDFQQIGTGGMGVVFLALDTELNRPVAVKVVRPPERRSGETVDTPTPFDISPPPADSDLAAAYSELTDRFLQEAWLTGALEHPGIVPVHEMGTTPRGVPYYTMRYVKGVRTLETALAGAKSVKDRMDLLGPFLHVCDAIRYAHSRGVIHRDLKPANLGIGEFGEVFVLDWGLAKMRDEPDAADSMWQERIRDFRNARDMHTVAKALGTPGYISPEAAFGDLHRVDERSDVYSLGSVLYRILTGRLPYEFESYADLLHEMREGPPVPASAVEPSISVELAEICSKALSFAREDRYAGAGQLADAIREHRRESGIRSEIRGLLQEAGAAFDAAEAMEGDGRLRQLDRVRALCHRVLDLNEDHSRARRLLAETDGLRRRTEEERVEILKAEAERARLASVEEEKARHRRRLRRAAVAVLLLFAVGTATAAVIFDGQRREAEAAEKDKTDLLSELGVTELDRDRAKAQIEALLESWRSGQADLARANAEVSSRDEELARVRDGLTGALEERDNARDRLERLESTLGGSQSEISAKGMAIEGLRRRVETLEQDLASAIGKREELARRAEEQAAALREKVVAIADLTAELAATEAKLDALAAAAKAPEPLSDREKKIRAWIQDIEELAEQPSDTALSTLLKFARWRAGANRPSEVRDAAIQALGRRGGEAVVNALLDYLGRADEDGDLQIEILNALVATGDPRAAKAILKLLRKGYGTKNLSRELFDSALHGLSVLRTVDSLQYLLDQNDRGRQKNWAGSARINVRVIRALQDLTGLPFELPETWGVWRRHSLAGWAPTPLAPPSEGREFRSDGWRLALERSDEEHWEFTRPEGTVVRIGRRGAPADVAWMEVRACSALEAFPRREDENAKAWEKRRLEEAAELGRLRIPESLRGVEGNVRPEPAVLGGERAVKLSAELPEEGGWRVYVVEMNHLLYTVTLHHGSGASEPVRKELDGILGSFRFLDRR